MPCTTCAIAGNHALASPRKEVEAKFEARNIFGNDNKEFQERDVRIASLARPSCGS